MCYTGEETKKGGFEKTKTEVSVLGLLPREITVIRSNKLVKDLLFCFPAVDMARAVATKYISQSRGLYRDLEILPDIGGCGDRLGGVVTVGGRGDSWWVW